jgi:endonuclease-3 related protein
MAQRSLHKIIDTVYQRLFKTFGPQHWWPAEEPFEVMVGAVLTQSAAWSNVEKAIKEMKARRLLSPAALRRVSLSELAETIHSSGYYNAKAVILKALAEWFGADCGDRLERLISGRWQDLRPELLKIHGVGEETADSILLYAAQQPVFVIDAYTRRIVDRLGQKPARAGYRDYQALFMENLPADSTLFNEYHALLVALGKNLCCKTQPLCPECPLNDFCLFAGEKVG